MLRFLAVLIAIVALSPHTYSQTSGKYLEGFESIRIATFLSGRFESCKVTEEDLRSAAAFPVATSRLRIDETSRFRLSVEVIALQHISGCSASVLLRAQVSHGILLDATQLTKFLNLDLWVQNL